MYDILHEVEIHVPPAKVYDAIVQEKGIASWWTALTKAKPEVGSVAEFGFDNWKFHIKMQVTALEPGHKVEWKTIQGAPDWGGTNITFDMIPSDHGTKLRFGHHNYATTEGSFASVSYTWASYLTSLKNYLETGKGSPNTA